MPKKWFLNLADHLLHDTTEFKDSHGWLYPTAEMRIIFKEERAGPLFIQKKGMFQK